MSPALTTFLFEAANFLILAGVLGWLFFRPVREAIERRRAVLQQQTDEAAERHAEAKRMGSEIEQRFLALEHEIDERRTQSRAAAEQQAEQILTTARETARREQETAKHQLAHLDRTQREQLASVIAATTAAAIDRLLRQLEHPGLAQALTVAACREIQKFDSRSLAPVRVESARPLNESDRNALLEALGPAGESAEFRVTEELGSGVRVSTSRGLVDVSAAGLSQFAENALARRLASDNESRGDDISHV